MGQKHLVAIVYGSNNECISVAKVENISEEKLNKLFNESNKYKENLNKEKENFKEELKNLLEKGLNAQNSLIAKAIYDKYVDRGLIEQNNDFDNAFYNFIFKGEELKIENAPADYLKILERLVK